MRVRNCLSRKIAEQGVTIGEGAGTTAHSDGGGHMLWLVEVQSLQPEPRARRLGMRGVHGFVAVPVAISVAVCAGPVAGVLLKITPAGAAPTDSAARGGPHLVAVVLPCRTTRIAPSAWAASSAASVTGSSGGASISTMS